MLASLRDTQFINEEDAKSLLPARRDWAKTLKAWIEETSQLEPQKQITAVKAKLQALNEGYDGELRIKVDDSGRVREVRLETSNIREISPLQVWPELDFLELHGDESKGQLTDLEPLRGMRIKRLKTQGNAKLKTIEPLKGMALEELSCSYTKVSDLSPLKKMPLKQAWFSSARVKDLKPLAESPIERLALSGCPVEDLSPLAAIKSLMGVELHYTPITDLSPLKGLSLKVIGFSGTASGLRRSCR